MLEKKVDKPKHEGKLRDDGVELENQFILRIPEEPAKVLHEALQNGNLKDRMTIKLDGDLRYGEVCLDQWLLHAKVVDLPTILECLKTIDNKSFYKSADICQMMLCKEEADALDTEKESPNKGKKKDPNKVDKKYLWPHGITPPCKNVRKRRFRKTLKKKNVEAPEIEKEVKRLLRIDNDAVKVDYEIINEDVDIDKRLEDEEEANVKDYNDGEDDYNDETMNEGDKMRDDSSSQKDINVETDGEDDDGPSGSATLGGVGEHDIFGEEVSSSENDDDDERNERSRIRDLEDGSRLSADDTRMSDFSIGGGGAGGGDGNLTLATDGTSNGGGNTSKEGHSGFNKHMFDSPSKPEADDMGSNSNLATGSGFYDDATTATAVKRHDTDEDDFSNDIPQLSTEQINSKIAELRRHYDDLKMQQAQKAQEISSIQNPTLKQRMEEMRDNLLSQMIEREMEIKDYENML